MSVHTHDDDVCSYCVSDVVHYNCSLGSSVVHWGQTVVSLLSGCVPDFKLYCCIIQADCLCEECSCKDDKGQDRKKEITDAELWE